LKKMTDEYEKASTKVTTNESTEYLDFHSRRLVEMAGNILMAYLLVINSQRDEKFKNSAVLFINLAESENQKKQHYIQNFDFESLDIYKQFV